MPSRSTEFQRPPAAAVLFFADGLSQRVLRRMLKAGELPNIERRFHTGGVEIENAIVNLPSLTYANATSLITGLFPGHHGILGNQWFDPLTLEYRDYGGPLTYRHGNADIRHATMYDLLAGHFTLNVQCHTRKGVTHTIDQDISSGLLWGLGRYETVDRRVGDVLPRVAGIVQRAGRWPIVWMNYFPGLDEIGHRYGPDSPNYASAIRNIDTQIGRIAHFAQEKSRMEKLYFVVLTDHGMVYSPPHRRPQLIDGLRINQRRVADRLRSTSPLRMRQLLEQVDLLAFAATDRCLALHLRGERGWGTQARPETTAAFLDNLPFWKLNAVQLVARRLTPDAVEVRSLEGRARIERRSEEQRTSYRYVVTDGDDPCGYARDESIAPMCSTWHNGDDWLQATAAKPIPDFVPQTIAMFDSPRAGDIVAFARDNWSFRKRFIAGHGSCLADDMRVSHFYAGPGLPAGGKVKAGRLVDVMPTVLDLLGFGERLVGLGGIDGVSRRAQLERPAQTPHAGCQF